MKLKKRFFCNSEANLIFMGAAYAAPALHMHGPKNTLGAAYASPTALVKISQVEGGREGLKEVWTFSQVSPFFYVKASLSE